jgi:hypothetical protein
MSLKRIGCACWNLKQTISTNLINRFDKVFNYVLLLKIRSTCAKKTIINRFFVLVGYEPEKNWLRLLEFEINDLQVMSLKRIGCGGWI